MKVKLIMTQVPQHIKRENENSASAERIHSHQHINNVRRNNLVRSDVFLAKYKMVPSFFFVDIVLQQITEKKQKEVKTEAENLVCCR